MKEQKNTPPKEYISKAETKLIIIELLLLIPIIVFLVLFF